ncbi:MAG: DUF4271 domain-containing protein, partial [Crocinitomicaceae bacterium]|nr:DUF4271 domain-containing protein [Crocinitomicaceae bacterium]
IFSIQLSLIPDELTLRDQAFTRSTGLLLLGGLLLIAFARLVRPNIYSTILIAMVKVSGLSGYIRDSLPLMKRGSILLFLNYLLSFGLVIHLWLGQGGMPMGDNVLISMSLPLLLFIAVVGSFYLTGWITGEPQVFKEPMIMKVIGVQSIGLIYILCALLWVLNSVPQNVIVDIIIWTFIIETLYRILKSMIVVYAMGVSWYYIILYFCTLEILPIFVVYYFILGNFSDNLFVN